MKKSGNIVDCIERIQITEKGTALAEKGKQPKYLFRVDPRANKLQIKQAVETFFNVKVAKVNTMNYLGKKKRLRTLRYGKKADWKRAVVTLREGSKIEMA
jgi:large subunit ribosomal protein L23